MRCYHELSSDSPDDQPLWDHIEQMVTARRSHKIIPRVDHEGKGRSQRRARSRGYPGFRFVHAEVEPTAYRAYFNPPHAAAKILAERLMNDLHTAMPDELTIPSRLTREHIPPLQVSDPATSVMSLEEAGL